ncbi:unnamed protein product [Tuber aestivum]|uniref:Uncharacterized protein n=1 Tax=Tuber aestivum TaxID=59557 RepID=A0A292PYB9_9PEZI|nr:unnamed protein product [Tuber aestivum]
MGPGLWSMEDLENLKAQDDEQGLGRTEVSDGTEGRLDASEETFPHGRPLEQVAELETRKRSGGPRLGDPFGIDDASPMGGEGVAGQGQDRSEDEMNTTDTNEPKVGGWASRASRAPMKRHGEGANRELRTDSFSFSKSEEKRQFLKQEAQKGFDAKVKKE